MWGINWTVHGGIDQLPSASSCIKTGGVTTDLECVSLLLSTHTSLLHYYKASSIDCQRCIHSVSTGCWCEASSGRSPCTTISDKAITGCNLTSLKELACILRHDSQLYQMQCVVAGGDVACLRYCFIEHTTVTKIRCPLLCLADASTSMPGYPMPYVPHLH